MLNIFVKKYQNVNNYKTLLKPNQGTNDERSVANAVSSGLCSSLTQKSHFENKSKWLF